MLVIKPYDTLGQRVDKKLHVIFYYNKSRDSTGMNYSTMKKSSQLAMFLTLYKFCPYQVGSLVFNIYHLDLKFLLANKNAKHMQVDQVDFLLQQIHFINKYKEVYNMVVDHLSRLLFEEKEELIIMNDDFSDE